jgi:hypothetical protein
MELISKISILEATANDPKGRALTIDESHCSPIRINFSRRLILMQHKGDQIARQQKLNSLADQATKFAQQQAAKQAEIDAAAAGTSTSEAERAATRQRLSVAYAFNPDAQKKFWLSRKRHTGRKTNFAVMAGWSKARMG